MLTASKPTIFSKMNPSTWKLEKAPCINQTSNFIETNHSKDQKEDAKLLKINPQKLQDSFKLKTNLIFSTGLAKIMFLPWNHSLNLLLLMLNLEHHLSIRQILKEGQQQKHQYTSGSQPSSSLDAHLLWWRQATMMIFLQKSLKVQKLTANQNNLSQQYAKDSKEVPSTNVNTRKKEKKMMKATIFQLLKSYKLSSLICDE